MKIEILFISALFALFIGLDLFVAASQPVVYTVNYTVVEDDSLEIKNGVILEEMKKGNDGEVTDIENEEDLIRNEELRRKNEEFKKATE